MSTRARAKPEGERIALSDLAYELGYWSHDIGWLFWTAIREDPTSGLWHQLLTPDQEASFRARIRSFEDTGARSCIWCRSVEPNTWILNNNHTELGFHAGHCMAQELTRNHVTYHVKRLTEGASCVIDRCTGQPMRYSDRNGWTFPDKQPITPANRQHVDYKAVRPLSARGRESEIEQLANSIERATQLWGHREDTDWLDQARDLLHREQAARRPPETTHAIHVSDEVAVLF